MPPRCARLGVGLALCGVLCPLPAGAASRPVVLDPVYVEASSAIPLPSSAHPCALHVTALADARRDPDMIGMVLGKPVRAPVDRAAWLVSIVNALGRRGYAVDFTDPGVDRPGTVNARITLQMLWVDTGMDLHQSAVFHLAASGGSGQVDGFYRGSESRMNWVASDGEVKGGVTTALTRALDAMAAALAPLCPMGPPIKR